MLSTTELTGNSGMNWFTPNSSGNERQEGRHQALLAVADQSVEELAVELLVLQGGLVTRDTIDDQSFDIVLLDDPGDAREVHVQLKLARAVVEELDHPALQVLAQVQAEGLGVAHDLLGVLVEGDHQAALLVGGPFQEQAIGRAQLLAKHAEERRTIALLLTHSSMVSGPLQACCIGPEADVVSRVPLPASRTRRRRQPSTRHQASHSARCSGRSGGGRLQHGVHPLRHMASSEPVETSLRHRRTPLPWVIMPVQLGAEVEGAGRSRCLASSVPSAWLATWVRKQRSARAFRLLGGSRTPLTTP